MQDPGENAAVKHAGLTELRHSRRTRLRTLGPGDVDLLYRVELRE